MYLIVFLENFSKSSKIKLLKDKTILLIKINMYIYTVCPINPIQGK